MHVKRKKRLYALLVIVFGVAVAVALALYALRQNLNLYYTPTDIVEHHVPANRVFRLGGMVEEGSVHRNKNTLDVTFVLTDYHHTVTVNYHGILPALFREGQGLVVQGKINSKDVFIANQVLAKHDENYLPPGIRKMKAEG